MSRGRPHKPCKHRPWQAFASDLLAERGVRSRLAIAYGDHPRHLLDIYTPRQPAATPADVPPIVLFVYGGSWRTGERGCYSFVGAALASRGITTIIPDYRLFPDVRYPAFNHDVAAALAWTRRTLDPDNRRPVILMGHSAGAHIATTLAYDRQYWQPTGRTIGPPDGVIAMSGPYAFDPTTWPTTKAIFATARDPQTPRPIAHVGPHCPPTLLIYGLKDNVVQPENARELHSALSACGVASSLIEYPGIGHILPITSFLALLRWRAPVLSDCLKFIGKVSARSDKIRPGPGSARRITTAGSEANA